MSPQEFKSVIDASGIRITEAAKLFRVAKTTIYRWMSDNSNPKQMAVYMDACKLAGLIHDATGKGYLPVQDVVGKARVHHIKTAIRLAAAERK